MAYYFSADWVFPVNAPPLRNGVVAATREGEILQVLTAEEAVAQDVRNVQFFEGAIVPGFINTHCHLELSHLRNKIPQRTGLVSFVQHILKLREIAETLVLNAARAADEEMQKNGIVAVGDISNNAITAAIKKESTLFYHTFVELLGIKPEGAAAAMANGLNVQSQFKELRSSLVPHAPYSVSPQLFDLIAGIEGENLLSIHNQETQAEQELFEYGKGAFLDFYKLLGIQELPLAATGKSAVHSYVPKLNKKERVLLVHNTCSSAADIAFVRKQRPQAFFCLCPAANLYIENSLPDVAMLQEAGVKITLGTDSLASNTALNILAEMKILQESKQVDFITLLKWATINGAEFLGVAGQMGSLTPGKKPGLNLIAYADGRITDTKVVRLI